MIVVNVLVEGQTEELFIKDILGPHMLDFGICLSPTIVNTKIVKDGPNYKGGLSNRNYERFVKDIRRLVSSTPHGFVTTFIDYYALPTKFPGYELLTSCTTPIDKVELLESQFAEVINSENFIPYIQLHEFETFLFSEEAGFRKNIEPSEGDIESLVKVINSHSNPEDINNGPATAPSKRIDNHYPSYQKVLEANMMVLDIGLDIIIQKCPHFKNWLELIKSKSRSN